MQTSLNKLLKAQLAGHAKLHLHTQALPARIVSSGGNEKSPSDDFRIDEKLVVYTGSCGAMARGELRDLKRSGMILLVKTSSKLGFHVEVGGADKEGAVNRVSTGAIVQDLEKAIQRARKRSPTRVKGSELRILRVPGMHVSAVWVHHPKRRTADVFVPYALNFAGLRSGHTYKRERIESLLKKQATQMILRWYDRYEKSLTQPNA